jgi:hypothetical protein
MERVINFEDVTWLFQCDNNNRGIIRLNFDEAALLWKAVKLSSGPILEIGRRHGGSTVLLKNATIDRVIFSIDIAPAHNPLCEEFFNLPENLKYLQLLNQDSKNTIPGQDFGLIFIDGDHSYEGVLNDTLAHWNSLISINNSIPLAVYHDAVPNDGLKYLDAENYCKGVKQLCDDLIQFGYGKKLKTAGSMILIEKIRDIDKKFPIRKDLFNDPHFKDNQG